MKTRNLWRYALLAAVAAVMTAGVLLSNPPAKTDRYTAAALTAEVRPVAVPREGVDVNHADAQALDELPGIGPVISLAIIEEREAEGFFYYPEDLLYVRGIGPARLAAIIDLIAIGE